MQKEVLVEAKNQEGTEGFFKEAQQKAVEVVKGEKEEFAVVNQEDIGEIAKEYLKLVGQNVPEGDAMKFLHICRAFGLNPFKREVYFIPYGKEANIIVGYEVYLKRAERSGKLSGWRVWTEGSLKDGTLKACIEIRRKDWEHPFYHEVWYREYMRNTQIWKEKPITMIKKVAIAQGFRLCFPEELGGLPYTAEEITSGEVVDVETGEVIEQKEWTIERIREVIDGELEKLIQEKKMKIKEVKELFKRHNGDIKAIKKELKNENGK